MKETENTAYIIIEDNSEPDKIIIDYYCSNCGTYHLTEDTEVCPTCGSKILGIKFFFSWWGA